MAVCAVRIIAYASACLSIFSFPLQTKAQRCGEDYVLKEDESLADIARRVYGSATQWSLVFYANQDKLGSNASLLVPGAKLTIPCLGKDNEKAAPHGSSSSGAGKLQLSPMLKRIEFLTADNYAPFTDRSLPEGGLTTNLVSAAMKTIKEEAQGKFDFNISWVNDWSAHLTPLLSAKAFDAGFPWSKPDCDHPDDLDEKGKFRCEKLFFSDPLYENVIPAFVKKEATMTFASDDEMIGKVVCRPKGYFTHLFDKDGRHWLRDKKITLLQPQSVEDCFRLLGDGKADVVVVSDFVGRAAIATLGMIGSVKALQRPVTIETFHVIVWKTHPNASSILYYVNSGLERLHASGEFDKIVDKQLSAFWAAQEAASAVKSK
jgi:polar amino acid transport system substrate-binding protein